MTLKIDCKIFVKRKLDGTTQLVMKMVKDGEEPFI